MAILLKGCAMIWRRIRCFLAWFSSSTTLSNVLMYCRPVKLLKCSTCSLILTQISSHHMLCANFLPTLLWDDYCSIAISNPSCPLSTQCLYSSPLWKRIQLLMLPPDMLLHFFLFPPVLDQTIAVSLSPLLSSPARDVWFFNLSLLCQVIYSSYCYNHFFPTHFLFFTASSSLYPFKHFLTELTHLIFMFLICIRHFILLVTCLKLMRFNSTQTESLSFVGFLCGFLLPPSLWSSAYC